MQVYRLTRRRYAGSLSGKGAALYPGRWNTVGQETIYTATSRALALVEILAHLPRSLIPRDFILQTIDIQAGKGPTMVWHVWVPKGVIEDVAALGPAIAAGAMHGPTPMIAPPPMPPEAP